MQIRNMENTDYPQVYDLWIHTPNMGMHPSDDSPEGIARYLSRTPTSCFVAEENGLIVGDILSGHDGRRGFIHHAAVAEAAQRKGIGSRLLKAALSALKAEGISKAALVAFEVNQKRNAFWEKQGLFIREDLVYRDKVLTD